MTTDPSAGQRSHSSRAFSIAFLLLVIVSMLGWLYAIVRGGITAIRWLTG